MNNVSILSKLFILLFVGLTTLATRFEDEQVAQRENPQAISELNGVVTKAN